MTNLEFINKQILQVGAAKTNNVSAGATEKIIQRDRVYESLYNGAAAKSYESSIFELNATKTLQVRTDLYGNLLQTDIDEDCYIYGYDSLSESKFAAKPQSVADSVTGDKTVYTYDSDGNLTGWKETNGNNTLCEVQSLGSKTKYYFGGQYSYYKTIEYDKDKIISPRVIGVRSEDQIVAGAGTDVVDKYIFNQYVDYDSQGNISMIYKPQGYTNQELLAIARYEYDAFGNCTVYDGNNQEVTDPSFIGNLNPFRWKGHYYDVETGLYYINGRYYDPAIGAYVGAVSIAEVIENALAPFALDRTGLMCNNVLGLAVNPYNVDTTVELSMVEMPIEDAPEISSNYWIAGGILAGLSFIFAAFTCGLGMAITVTVVGAGAGAAYGAFSAFVNKQDVGKGALIGMISGIIMANTALMGINIAVSPTGAWAVVTSDIVKGVTVSAAGGIVAGSWSSIASQMTNYGKITNPASIAISAISYALGNIFSMYLGGATEPSHNYFIEGFVNFFYNIISGIIGAVPEVF